MNWRETFRTAFEAVRIHRLRSALTMLGILIGISAVMLTVGLGQGAQAEVREQISALGTNVLVISAGSSTDSSGSRGGAGSSSTLTIADAEAIASDDAAPDVAAVAPVASSSVSFTAGENNWTSTLLGTTPSWKTVRSRHLLSGRFITQEDVDSNALVAVIGVDTAEELFDTTDVVGETITYDGTTLTIVGVLEELSSSDDTSSNDQVIVPISTYQERLIGGTNRTSVSTIIVKADSESTLSAAYQEVDAILTQTHDLEAGEDADYSIASQESVLSAAASVDDTITVMLGGIAVISLLVGGIGVMNIMLVSVNERIREIGLRKSLGARPGAIRRQFMVEACALGFGGGLLGVALGVVGGWVLPSLTDSRVETSVLAAVVSVLLAMVIGVTFGVYPATRAARLAPIDALRSE